MNIKLFQKKIENFTCTHCGTEVIGNGYTNHCPKCLWSQHVDVNPGDRLATCKGMMRPARIESNKEKLMIIHICETCRYAKRNSVSPHDNMDTIAAVAKAFAEKVQNGSKR
jgi:hypothetical protein